MSGAERFTYAGMVARQPGFVTDAEQERLRLAGVFVCGTGGMGGIAAQALVRGGVGRLALADVDTFELSNLNRQIFADTTTIGASKAPVTADRLRRINPDLVVAHHGAHWTLALDDILRTHPVVINAMDDVSAGLHLYRRAAALGATVIDAYLSPLPNVTVVRPADPRPEQRLGFPTFGTTWCEVSAEQVAACRIAELAYVLVHTSSAEHFDTSIAASVFAGRRARPSFAPVVWMAGTLMAFEALNALLQRPSAVDHRGVFYNPWTAQTERPRSPMMAALRRPFVMRRLRRLTGEATP